MGAIKDKQIIEYIGKACYYVVTEIIQDFTDLENFEPGKSYYQQTAFTPNIDLISSHSAANMTHGFNPLRLLLDADINTSTDLLRSRAAAIAYFKERQAGYEAGNVSFTYPVIGGDALQSMSHEQLKDHSQYSLSLSFHIHIPAGADRQYKQTISQLIKGAPWQVKSKTTGLVTLLCLSKSLNIAYRPYRHFEGYFYNHLLGYSNPLPAIIPNEDLGQYLDDIKSLLH